MLSAAAFPLRTTATNKNFNNNNYTINFRRGIFLSDGLPAVPLNRGAYLLEVVCVCARMCVHAVI